MGKKKKKKRGSYKVRIATCAICDEDYKTKGRRACNDGKLRCKKCKRKRHTERFIEKHGASRYEVYGKDNPDYKRRQREWNLQHRYGLTLETYDRLLDLQGGVCAICKGSPKEGENLPVDHDHDTGAVRGLLCHPCNRAVGVFQDDLATLRSAATYLLRHDSGRSWDHYFLEHARVAATRSKDPSSQVGAIIVRDRTILSTGYNGFPRGVNDDIPERYERPTKYTWVVHGEENAILNACRNGVGVMGATLYVTPFAPCVPCAKAIIQSGIREVVIDARIENPRWVEEFKVADTILKAAKVLVRGPE